MPDDGPRRLRLLDALIEWCEPSVVDRIRQEERQLTAHVLDDLRRPKLTPRHEWRQPTGNDWKAPRYTDQLLAAWKDVERDFVRRIEIGELHLAGVPATADEDAPPVAIPSAWAADIAFDFDSNTARRGDRRYLAVTVGQAPIAKTLQATAVAPASKREAITEANVHQLTDEEVLILLEDHARRVVETPDAELITPGKISLLPIIRRKMLHRATMGETRETLGAEADALAKWIAAKVPSHQAPTASTIEKGLRRDYMRPIRRSKAEIG